MKNRKFYAVHEGNTPNMLERVAVLESAARERDLEFIALNSLTTDYTSLPNPKLGDLLFNVGRGGNRLETLLTIEGVVTLRKHRSKLVLAHNDTTICTAAHTRAGLAEPRTIHNLPTDKSQLHHYVDYLGGFPILLKEHGSTRGAGVFYCDSMHSLISMTEDFRTAGREFIMREYIPHSILYRVVVLDTKVLCTVSRPIRPGDFRSTIEDEYELVVKTPKEMATLAISALELCEFEFGGADIVFDQDRGPLLLEVNPPCNFATIKKQVGQDIAGPIVDHLINKSNSLLEPNGQRY